MSLSGPPFDDTQQALTVAVEHHTSGRLQEAEAIYRAILKQDPDQPVALNLLGMVATQTGNFDAAIDLLNRAISIVPDYSVALCNLGNVYKEREQLDKAIEIYQRALRAQPDYATAHFNLGMTYKRRNQLNDAIRSLENAIQYNADYDKAHTSLADIYKSREDTAPAIAHYRQALAINPGQINALINLGVSLNAVGETDQAIDCYLKAIKINANIPEAHNNLGKIYRETGRYDQAYACYQRALQINPTYFSALNNMAIVLRDLGQKEEAREICRKMIGLYPEKSDSFVNMGNALLDQLLLDEAIVNYDKAIDIEPDHSEAYCSKGVALKDLGRMDEARDALEQSIRISPDNTLAKHNLALVHLLNADYKTGWQMFEHRWRDKPKELGWREFPIAMWDGSSLHGKRLLVWGEQGIGDEIVYASLYRQLIEQGAQCYFECLPRLVPLFERSFPEAIVVAKKVPADQRLVDQDIDFQIPAASLMRFLLRSLDKGENRESYLKVNEDLAQSLRQHYQGNSQKKLVGIGWRTSHASLNPRYDVPLSWFDELLKIPNVQFVNLQYGDHQQELSESFQRTGVEIFKDPNIDPLDDMDAFAAQVSAMDLVISIVTSTAVTASAVGTPVWGIVPKVSEWRWGNNSDHCLWFPSMPLFRQQARGDWSEPFNQLASAFESWVSG